MIKIPPIEVIEYFNADINKVWNTFVNSNGWDPWFTDGMKVELVEGGKITFVWKRLTGEEVIDHGVTVKIIERRLWEFWWYEYEDGYRSHVEMKFQESPDGGVWVKIKDSVKILKEDELKILYGCSYGWGQMMLLAKIWIERNMIVI